MTRTNNTGTPENPGPEATWVYTYDKLNNRVTEQDPRGEYFTTKWDYDALGRQFRAEYPRGLPSLPLESAVEVYDFDSAGRLISATGPRIGTSGELLQTTYDYDPAGRQFMVTDAAGIESIFTYDRNGNVIEERHLGGDLALDRILTHTFDQNDRQISTTDAAGYLIEFDYDEVNNLIETIGPMKDSSGALATHTTTFDAANRARIINDQEGYVSRFEYDGAGNTIAETDGRGAYYTSTHLYDGKNRIVETTVPTGTETAPGAPSTTQFVYSNAGQTITEIDPRGPEFATIRTYTVDRQIASQNLFVGRTLLDSDRTLERWEYDAAGYAKAYVDPRGPDFQMEFVYDAAGLLYETSTVAGTAEEPRRIRQTFAYDKSGNQTQKVDFGGPDFITTIEYDDLDFPTAIIDAAGEEIRYLVDRFGNPVVTTDKFGTTLREYDQIDRPTKVVNGAGDTSFMFYPDANTTITRDGRTNETTTVNDGLGRLRKMTDALDGVTEYFYDAVGNLESLVDAVGNRHVTEYDARSLPIRQTIGEGSLAEATTQWEYDLLGRQIRQIDPRDTTGEFYAADIFHDGLGRVVESRRSAATPTFTENVPVTPGFDAIVTQLFYDEVGNLIKEVPEGGEAYAVHYSHNNLGQVNEIRRNTGAADSPRDSVTRMSYNDNGDLIELIDPLGYVTTFQYDSVGRKTERRIQSDEPGGDLVRTWDYSFINDRPTITIIDELGSVATTMHFDGAGRVNREETRGEPDKVTTYDSAGNVETVTIGNWSETHQYDARNHLSQTTDGDGQTRRYEFDAVGNLRFFFEADNAPPTEYVFNSRNQTTRVIDPLGNETSYDYDEVGNVKHVIDAGGEQTSYAYDGLDRLLSVTNTFGTMSYSYNAQGDQTKMVDRNGRRIDYEYNLASNLISETWFNPSGSDVGRIDYDVDASGRVKSVNHGGTSVILSLTDDASSRLLRESTTINGTTFQIDHLVDAAERATRTSATLDGQSEAFVANDYVYDSTSQKLQRVDQSGTFVSDKSVTLTHDPDLPGVVSGIARSSGGGTNVTTTVTRNNRSLIESIDHLASGVNESFNYEYYSDGQLRTAGDSEQSNTYFYDDANRLVGVQTAGTGAETFSYDEAGNPNSPGFDVADGNRLDSDGVSEFDYDAEGNLTLITDLQSGATKTLDWDHHNRLTSVTFKESDGTVVWKVEHEYDGLDRRVRELYWESDGSGQLQIIEDRLFLYDGSELLAEVTVDSSGEETIDVVYLTDATTDSTHAQDFGDGDFHWLLQDRQESTRLILDPQASVVDQLIYNAYGVLLSSLNPEPASRILYTGGQFAPHLDVYYNRARFYDPSIGRFWSTDPSGFLGGDANLYRYAEGDPVNKLDPGGLSASRVGSAQVTSDVSGSFSNRIASVWGSGVANPLGNGGRDFQQSVAQNSVNINGAIARDLKPIVEMTGFYASLAVGVFSDLRNAPGRSVNELHRLGYERLNRFGSFAQTQSDRIELELNAISAHSKSLAQDAAKLFESNDSFSLGSYARNQFIHLGAVSAATLLTIADELLQLGAAVADAAVIEMEGYGLPSERAQRKRYSKITQAFEQQGALKVAKMAFDAIVDIPNQLTSGDAAAQAQAITAIGEVIAAPAAAGAKAAAGGVVRGTIRAGGRGLRLLQKIKPPQRLVKAAGYFGDFLESRRLSRKLHVDEYSDALSYNDFKKMHSDSRIDFDGLDAQVELYFAQPKVAEALSGLTKADIERLKDITKVIEVSRVLKEPIPPNHFTVIKPDAPGPDAYLLDPKDGLAKRIKDFRDPDVKNRTDTAQALAKKLEEVAAPELGDRLQKFSVSLSKFMGLKGRVGLPNVWNKLNDVMENAITKVAGPDSTGTITQRLEKLTPEQAAQVIREVDRQSVRNPIMTEITAQFAASPAHGGRWGINGVFERGSFGASLDQFLFRSEWVLDIVSGEKTPFSVLQGERFVFAWRTVSDLFKTPLGPGSDFDLNFTTETLNQFRKLSRKAERDVFDKKKGEVVKKKIPGAEVIDQFYAFSKEQIGKRLEEARKATDTDPDLIEQLESLEEAFDRFEQQNRKYDLVELYKQDEAEFRELVRRGLDSGAPIKKGAHGYTVVHKRGWGNPFAASPEGAPKAASIREAALDFYDKLRPVYDTSVQRVQYLGNVFVGRSDRIVLDDNFKVPPPLQLIAAGIYGPVPLHSGINYIDASNTARHIACDDSVFESIDACGDWAIETWIEAIDIDPGIEIEFEFEDLHESQLGTTSILNRDDQGRPLSAIVQVDIDANGRGWQLGGYDLATVLLHEVGHALGFDATTPAFSNFVDADSEGLTYHIDTDLLRLDRSGSELDPNLHQDAVMAASLPPGIRKSLTDADIAPLREIWDSATPSATLITSRSTAEPEFIDLPVTDVVPEATGLTNEQFEQSDTSASDFGWRTIGGVTVDESVATISEDVGMISDLSQTFVIPSGVSTISFTLTGISMDVGSQSFGNDSHPPEIFEVAILDSITGTSLLPETTGLVGGDALFNLQADGTVYFADGVRVGGANRSGRTVDFSQPIDVIINLPVDTARETATLMFDLVGFGEDASQVEVSKILLEATNGWQNPIDRFDVDDKGSVSTLDALIVINELARVSVHDPITNKLAEITDEVGPPPFYDVTGDGFITPLDALHVINQLARQQQFNPESVDSALEGLLDED